MNGPDSDDGIPYEPAWLPTLFDIDDLLDVLDIRVQAPPLVLRCLDSSHGGILATQLVAQQVVLAERLVPGRRVRTLHTLFTRPGRNDRVLEVDVERLHVDEAFAALVLTFRQGGDLICQAQVMLSGGEHDLAHAGDGSGGLLPPAQSRRVRRALIPWDACDVPGTRSQDAELWLRAPSPVGDDATLWCALLAHASVVPALQQRADGSGSGAPSGEETAVLSHSLTILAPLDVREWHFVRTWSHATNGGQAVCHGEFRGPGGRLGAVFETAGLLERRSLAT